MDNHCLRHVITSDLDRCFEIESLSYEGDEAATRDKIQKRIRQYPEGFIVLELKGVVVGFINCGATTHVDLSSEDLKDLKGHDPNGKHIVILSVVVHRDHQNQGFAGMLIEHFISKMREMEKSSIHLICKYELVGFYHQYGFEYVGKSASAHGGLDWHEMVLRL